MSENKTVRIGVIGAGSIGRVHMETFGQVPDARVAAVTDVYREGAEKSAADFDIPKVHDNAESLIADDDIDAVVVGVPNRWHAPLAVQALQAGKHVLLEKPMALNLEDARNIYEAAKNSGRTLMIAHQMRWEAMSMKVREMAGQELGRIYHAKTGWFRRKGIPGWGSWFTRKEQSGGGPLIDIGVHMLDLTLYLMGNPKPVSVFGSTYAEFGPKKKGIGTWGKPDWDGYFDVEDIASAFIKMEDGSSLTLDVSWAVNMETDNQPFVHLLGSDAGVTMRGNRATLFREVEDRTEDVNLEAPDDDKGARMRLSRHFIECVKEGKQPLTDALSGYTNQMILEAIYESSRTGKEVRLDWTPTGEIMR